LPRTDVPLSGHAVLRQADLGGLRGAGHVSIRSEALGSTVLGLLDVPLVRGTSHAALQPKVLRVFVLVHGHARAQLVGGLVCAVDHVLSLVVVVVVVVVMVVVGEMERRILVFV
jgi:hypothetical protein